MIERNLFNVPPEGAVAHLNLLPTDSLGIWPDKAAALPRQLEATQTCRNQKKPPSPAHPLPLPDHQATM